MNWLQISINYPKAFSKLEQWGNHPAVLSRQKKRLLYNFFDENKIFLWVEPEIQYTRDIDEDGNNPHYVVESWSYMIHNNRITLFSNSGFKNRTKAEGKAFTKAFGILNDKLK